MQVTNVLLEEIVQNLHSYICISVGLTKLIFILIYKSLNNNSVKLFCLSYTLQSFWLFFSYVLAPIIYASS